MKTPVELFICLFLILSVLHNNSNEAFIIRFKMLTFLWLKRIAGFEYGYGLGNGFLSCVSSLCNVNMFCMVQCSYQVWNPNASPYPYLSPALCLSHYRRAKRTCQRTRVCHLARYLRKKSITAFDSIAFTYRLHCTHRQ